ncbi:MAG: TIGR00159 family protein [Fimbriimonas ginsengisoli]|uniref:Diadenylate cyclase n=1 Tax=Fimbriimonas ginsengisoli TaxID=1005039 RepID=A0A931LWB3_FIMGI|nr:TIGR00159 family protein [Fimbriimonas ginsengisoli]MBI3721531.1 TIGR00159 family protein [Fimbriimonas ginsengisoli]
MEEIRRRLTSLFDPTWDNFVHVADILLVALLIYQVPRLIRGTRGWRIFLGVIAFLVLLGLSSLLKLDTLHWLLDKATALGPVALVILFLPELRQALEGVVSFVPQFGVSATEARTIEELVAASAELSSQNTGALIVVERTASLNELAENGVQLDARVTSPLLGSIFYEKNPLHDGAAIVRGDRLRAAACRLPLSESTRLDRHVHMRHRAAVGVTENFDCVAIVVSEERGTISLAVGGQLERLSTPAELRERLNQELRSPVTDDDRPRRPRSKKKQEAAV